jgi:hypothetical protein
VANFNLSLEIDSASLKLIRAAQERIILAKPVGTGSAPNVVWQSFDPFESNEVTWTEEFGVYASDAVLVAGANIRKMSDQEPADEAHYYTFGAGATFEGPFTDPRVGAGQYGALNAMPNSSYPQLTFGLTQTATINAQTAKGRPLNAVSVLPNRFVTFTPITTVYVWLESNLASSTVITSIVANQTVVKYSGAITTRELVYDPDSGMFIPKRVPGSKSNASDPDVTLIRPLIW